MPSGRRTLVTLALGVGAMVLALLAGRVGFIQTLDWKLYDQHVRLAADPATASPRIVVVNIDETSLRGMQPLVGRWPWPRLVHASVVDFLARGPATAVVYDVVFTDPDTRLGFDVGGQTWTGPESDQAFADAVAKAGNVIVIADAAFEGWRNAEAPGPDGGRDATRVTAAEAGTGLLPIALDGSFEERPVVTPPYPTLGAAARAWGHNLVVLDPDGPLRRVVPFVRHHGRFLPSLEMAAVALADRADASTIRLEGDDVIVGARRLPLLRDRLPRFAGQADTTPQTGRRLLVDFRGPPVLADGQTTTYREYSFWDLFYSEEQILAGETPTVDPAVFRDALVFIGVSATGLHDIFAGPFGDARVPGAYVRATVADQVLANRAIRPAPGWATALVALVAGLLAAAGFTRYTARPASLAAVLILLLLAVGSLAAFKRGYWLSLAPPLLATMTAGVAGLAYQYLVEGREKRAVKQLFSRYLSKDVYEQVLANPALAELGGKRRDMTVLFSDIRGFTAVTEKGDPEALVAQLNEYFSCMVDIVFAHRGTLDKFVGDMVMALYGAPLDDVDHADHAVETALAMVAELNRLNGKWASEGRPTLGIGIGINSGDMIAGNIGSSRIRSYTVIGDNVNLGARLESLNKDYRTSIIISEHTATRLRGRYDLHPLGDVVVKGKSVPVAIFEVRADKKVQTS